MPNAIKLSKLVEEMGAQFDGATSYLEKSTGELHMIRDEEMETADADEPIEEFPEWEQEAIGVARRILESDDFIPLPNQYELHEYDIMREFCGTVKNKKIRDDLHRALDGRSPFRAFKDKIQDHDVQGEWFRYRDGALKKLAIEWCKENGIAYADK
jgi:hypothetical protein